MQQALSPEAMEGKADKGQWKCGTVMETVSNEHMATGSDCLLQCGHAQATGGRPARTDTDHHAAGQRKAVAIQKRRARQS